MYQFIQKNKKQLISILFIFSSILLCFYMEKMIYVRDFSIHRLFIYLVFVGLVTISCIFDYKKVWNYIFKKRYLIGIIAFIFMVAMGYNVSSIGQYNYAIQPNNSSSSYLPFWNKSRSIRSDEFIATTPTLLSQEVKNTFSSTNDAIMARKTKVLLLPRVATKNISILASPQLIGFIIFDATRGYSFCSLFLIFLSFFSVFELMLILTGNKKLLSLVGTMLLVFSPSTLWWNSQCYLGYGTLCVVLLNLFLNASTKKKKILFSILFGISGSGFISLAYPAWQVPYGYLYLLLMIWIIIKNKEKAKVKDLLYALLSLVVAIAIAAPAYLGSREMLEIMSHTVYPGSRNSTGGTGWEQLYLYFGSLLYGVRDVVNASAYSQYFSLYPIPMALGIYHCIAGIRKKKVDILLVFLTVYALLLNIWNYIPIGSISKIFLLHMSTPERSQLIVSIINVLIMIKLLSDYSSSKFSYKRLYIGIPVAMLTVLVSVKATEIVTPNYLSLYRTAFFSTLFFMLIVLLIINYKKTNRLLLLILILMSLFVVGTVNPITQGIHVMTDKPLAKEIRKIIKKDKNAVWISSNTSLFTSNYVLANGGRVINSVNFYPNLKLWHKFDKERKYEDIYNRYAHITIDITDEETTFKLIGADYFNIQMNHDDVCKLKARYIVTSDDSIDKYNDDQIELSKVYSEDGSTIFKIKCEE